MAEQGRCRLVKFPRDEATNARPYENDTRSEGKGLNKFVRPDACPVEYDVPEGYRHSFCGHEQRTEELYSKEAKRHSCKDYLS